MNKTRKINNKKSYFQNFARFIKKNRLVVLVLWIILAGLATPFAIQLNKKVQTNEVQYLLETPAGQGLDLLAEKFPQFGGGSFAIVIDQLHPENLTAENLVNFVSEIRNQLELSGNYPSIDKVVSIYTMLYDFQQMYNITLTNIFNQLNTTLDQQLPELYTYMTYTNDTIKSTIDMLNQIPLLYSATWWNISRFVFYTANQTNAYQTGFLEDSELVLLSNWLMMDNTTLNQFLLATLPISNIIPFMQLDPYFADNVTTTLAFAAVNQTLSSTYNETEFGIPYEESLLYNYLISVNATFQLILENDIHTTQALFNEYYVLDNPNATDFALGMNSQLTVFNTLNQQLDEIESQAGQLLLDSIGDTSEIKPILQLAYQLRNEDYTTSPLYKQGFIQLMVGFLNNSISDLFSIPEDSDIEFDSSEILSEEDIDVIVTLLYDTEEHELTPVLELIKTNVVTQIKQYIAQNVPYPTSILNLPSDIYFAFISADNTTMIVSVMSSNDNLDEGYQMTPIIRSLVKELKQQYDINSDVYVTGDLALFYDIHEASERDVSRTDKVTILFVLFVLLLVFLSPITPFVPLVTIGLAILVIQGIFVLMTNFMDISSYSSIITTVVMMGAGVDYCIFMTFRYKEQREKKDDKDNAVHKSMKHIGESIITSGLTVMVGFGSLLLSQLTLLRLLGMGPIMGIAVSLLAALTFIPALLYTFGDKIYWPRFHLNNKKTQTKSGSKTKNKTKLLNTDRIIKVTVDHPWAVIFGFILISSPFIYYGVTLQKSYDLTASIPKTIESVAGMDVLARSFVMGELQPVQVIINCDEPLQLNSSTGLPTENVLQAVEQISTVLLDQYNIVSSIKTITRPNGEYISQDGITEFQLQQMLQFFSRDNTSILMFIYLDIDPFSKEAIEIIPKISETIDELINASPVFSNVEITITGITALYSDLSIILKHDTPIMVTVTLIGVFLVLFVLLGSIFTPLRLELTILVSVYISLGMTNIIFHYILDQPIIWFIPVTLFVTMFGLGMDFDILLVSRIKEEVEKGASEKEAIKIAVKNTASLITSAGFIMASAFFSLLLSELWPLKIIGFAIGIAVLLDATVIRLLLVPALMMVMHRWNWWPYLR
ncbi:MAG: MMPL family transporter, partial [Candidatus Heimdallarchaeaceae archaeon]